MTLIASSNHQSLIYSMQSLLGSMRQLAEAGEAISLGGNFDPFGIVETSG
jgi:hypothetical protein